MAYFKAIPLYTLVLGTKTDSGVCRVLTTSPTADEPRLTEFNLPTDKQALQPGIPKWANYVKGVVAFFKGRPTTLPLSHLKIVLNFLALSPRKLYKWK